MKMKTRPQPPQRIPVSAAMREIIAEAYSVFNRPLGNRLTDVCTDCCVSPENERLLIATPVDKLSVALIYEYLDAAESDKRENEIAHFLPRILELIAEHADIRHSTEITLSKCAFDNGMWLPKQIEVVLRFAERFIEDILRFSPENRNIDMASNYILMFDLAGLPTKQLFEIWENTAPKHFTAVEHFERLMRYDFDNFGRYINAFSVHPEFNQAIFAWVHCPKTAKIFIDPIEKYYFDHEETDDIERYRWEVLYDFCIDSLRKNT